MAPIAPRYVEAPPVTPLPYGLYSAALVLEDSDPHTGLGVMYEPDACEGAFTTVAACMADGRPTGALVGSVSNTRELTLDGTTVPEGSYVVLWGDATGPEAFTAAQINDNSTADHTYASAGTYTVTVEGPDGWRGAAVVTVPNASTSGPFDFTPRYGKVATDGTPLIEGDPFTIYHLHRCRPIGRDDLMARARTGLTLGEQRAVEGEFIAQLSAADADSPVLDLTPTAGTPVTVAVGLALLEKYAAQVYGGVPIIHAPRDVGSLLGSVGSLVRTGDHMESQLGARVASGGGYAGTVGPDGSADAEEGEAWVYVTGTVVIRRLPIVEAGVPVDTTNTASMLVERGIVATYECFAAAVLVSTSELF